MADVGVRLARRTDIDAVAHIQVRSWMCDFRDFVPQSLLAELTGPTALGLWRQHWTEAVTAPPSRHHKVLVAVERETVTGFAACVPADEPGQDPEKAAEIITLRVDPDHSGAGHDSRLLAAAADLLRDDGFGTLITWLFEADEAQQAFFVSAGWAPDGARRTLSFPASEGDLVPMIRLHTDISRPEEPADQEPAEDAP
jgi:ribosomal protein S18 acetylase RimI-like enzyme